MCTHKTARHARIIALLEPHEVRSQTELAELLAGEEFRSTKAPCPAIWLRLAPCGYAVQAGSSSMRCRARAATGRLTLASSLASKRGWPGCAARCWSPPRRRPTSSCSAPRRVRHSTSPRPSIGWAGIHPGHHRRRRHGLADHPEPHGGNAGRDQFLIMSRTGK